jgi:predicted dinucleotide-utilizing enzyme
MSARPKLGNGAQDGKFDPKEFCLTDEDKLRLIDVVEKISLEIYRASLEGIMVGILPDTEIGEDDIERATGFHIYLNNNGMWGDDEVVIDLDVLVEAASSSLLEREELKQLADGLRILIEKIEAIPPYEP